MLERKLEAILHADNDQALDLALSLPSDAKKPPPTSNKDSDTQ